MRKRFAVISGGLVVLALVIALVIINFQITPWVEGPDFQSMLDNETSKGLKLNGTYASMHRMGVFGLSTDSFMGTEGYKTILTLQAQGISGTFNPLGMVLRRWEIDSLHIKSGSVMLQKPRLLRAAARGYRGRPGGLCSGPTGSISPM